MKVKMRYAILLRMTIGSDTAGHMTEFNRWYGGFGKHSNSFSSSSSLDGARFFPTREKAQEELNCASFQYRLKAENEMNEEIGIQPYIPTIIPIGSFNH